MSQIIIIPRFASLKLLLSLLTIVTVCCLQAQRSDHEWDLRFDELSQQGEEPEADDSPVAVVEDEGTLKFYFIETVRQRNRPQLYVRMGSGFEAIRPAFGIRGPLHQLNADSRIIFYERISIEENGETWHHVPRYAVSLTGHGGEKIVVLLPQRSAAGNAPDADVRPMRWFELTRDLYDFGQIAVLNPFEQPMALQIDGENLLLEPGHSHSRPFRLWRRQTAAVRIRIAMRSRATDFQELFNGRVYIFENWRGLYIPYFNHLTGQLGLIEIREQPPD